MRRLAVGIDIGGSTIKAARVGSAGLLCEVETIPTPQLAADLTAACVELVENLSDDAVAVVGVGAAGLVDRSEGTIIWGPHLPSAVALAEPIQKLTGLPVEVDNDADAAALAELRLGAARGYQNVLVVMLGTGIGGAIVVDGVPYRGRGFAGEIGHFVLDPQGPECTCGKWGCWETLVSGTVLDRASQRILRDPSPTGRDLMLAARSGNVLAREAFDEAGSWLGRGVAELAAVLDPEVVVVGGAPSEAGDLLLDPAELVLADQVHGPVSPPPLVASRFGRESAVIGAGLLALENLHD